MAGIGCTRGILLGDRPCRRRVVVTGLGAISPLGATFVESWEALVAGRCGVTDLGAALRLQQLDEARLERELEVARQLPSQVAAPVQSCPPYDSRTTARFVQFALVAAGEALRHSGLLALLEQRQRHPNDFYDSVLRHRTGVCIASGMSGVRDIVQAYETLVRGGGSGADGGTGAGAGGGYRKLSPHFVPKVLANSASGRVALQFGLQGPNHACATACAAGTHALGDAYRMIQMGTADVMVAGGTEAAIDPLGLAGFGRLRALSTRHNDDPTRSSRPFDKDRDGFVMGEGAAVLVLESLDHALGRNATILAEVTGYGTSGDAYHVTAPDPHGRGAIRCMVQAIDEHHHHRSSPQAAAGTTTASTPTEAADRHPIGYVNAHATSTPKGDDIEALAISSALGDAYEAVEKVLVSSTKGSTGHLLGAAGALEAAFCVRALVDRRLPPPLNLESPDVDVGECLNLMLMRHAMTSSDTDAAVPSAVMSNSFGFGGTNASITLQRWA
jgi:3-oxoacyl-[acyl-carrier-protein] synthase II